MNKKIRTASMLALLIVAFTLTGCKPSASGEWDNLGGGGSGEIQDGADTSGIDDIGNKGSDIIGDLDNAQTDVSDTNAESLAKNKISEPGDYRISGEIDGKINVKAAGVRLFLDNATIVNTGDKVISSDYDLVIILVEGTTNSVTNTGEDAKEANAISVDGKLTINGDGVLSVSSTKSAIKADGAFYGLGGSLNVHAGSGHGISADAVILTGGSYTIVGAAKDGIHAETDDEVLINDPVFSANRGYFYISDGVNLTISDVYGDGIQADTFALIAGGELNIKTLPTFVKATSKDGCYEYKNGGYSRIASEDIRSYSGLYQLSQSNKGIKVGEIDYTDGDSEHAIVLNTAYSLVIAGGRLVIATTDDALHTNSGDLQISGGNISITTGDDAVAADRNVTISGGTVTILQSYEGIEAETIDISGGHIIVNASDDGINAASDATSAKQKQTCYIKISGGQIFVNASGDGIDSNGGVQISGGELYVYGPTSGRDGSLDSETGIIVTGGTLIALGSSGMVETPATNSTQYVIAINLKSSVSGQVEVKDGSKLLATFDPVSVFGVVKNYQSIIVSHASFVKNATYSIISGATTTSAKTTSVITKIGTSAGPGTGGR